MQRCVAVVPAKRTSRRIQGKNLRHLGGRPLLYYSVRIAQVVPEIDAVYVSSEDEKILSLARELGAETIVRPAPLSRDGVSTREVLEHAYGEIVERLSSAPTEVALLQPPHPLRRVEDVSGAIAAFRARPEADSLFTVAPTDELRARIEDGWLAAEFPLPRVKAEEPEMYWNTGSVYLFRPERSFLKASYFGERIHPYVVERSEIHIDIDYPADLRLAECILEANRERLDHFG